MALRREFIDEQAGPERPAELTVAHSITEVSSFHGEVEVGREIVGWTLRTSDKVEHDNLRIIVSGFGLPEAAIEPFSRESALQGSATLTYSPARRDSKTLLERIKDPQEIHIETIGKVLQDVRRTPSQRRPMAAYGVDLDRTSIIAYSMGGEPADRYAEQNPVESITKVAALGLGRIHIENAVELVQGWPVSVLPILWYEAIPLIRSLELSKSNLWNIIRHNAASPSQTVSEMLSCLTYDGKSPSNRLRKAGVWIGYIALEHDQFIKPIQDIGSYVDDFTVMKNVGHPAPIAKPKEMVAAINEQLSKRKVVVQF